MALRKASARFILHSVIIISLIIWIVPTLGLLITSFRPAEEVNSTGWWTVFSSPLDFTKYTLDNYRQVIKAGGMGIAFKNSLIITVFGTLFPVLIAAFAAFGLSRLYFRGRSFISMLMPLVIFFSLQRYFVKGILAGSVKG